MPKKKAGTPQSSRPHATGYGFPKGKKGLLPWSWAAQPEEVAQLLDHHREA